MVTAMPFGGRLLLQLDWRDLNRLAWSPLCGKEMMRNFIFCIREDIVTVAVNAARK